jgi:hypothetical protein
MWNAPTAFLRAASITFVRKKSNERSKQKRTKPSAKAIRSLQCRMLQKVDEEFLGQIFSLAFSITARANKLVQGLPIAAAQVFQGIFGACLATKRRLGQQSPLGRWKVHQAAPITSISAFLSPIADKSIAPAHLLTLRGDLSESGTSEHQHNVAGHGISWPASTLDASWARFTISAPLFQGWD